MKKEEFMKKVVVLMLAVVFVMSITVLNIGCKEPEVIIETVTETVVETVTETVEVEAEKEEMFFAYVIHIPTPFTESIKRGAEAAALNYNASMEVVIPSKFDTLEQIALFEAMIAKGAVAITVVAADAAAWIVPIQGAADAGVKVATANVYAEGSVANMYAGTSGWSEGQALGDAILNDPDAPIDQVGKVVIGSCLPGLPVLEGRTNGLIDKLSTNPNWELSDVLDTSLSLDSTVTFWETAYNANPDLVMGVGSCAFDLPSIFKVKSKNPNVDFYFAGYDLEPDALSALQEGYANITIGQGPYLQGYLPMMAFFEHFLLGNPLTEGWADPGSEVVTQANVEDFVERETNQFAESEWYAKVIEEQFTPIWEKVKPWDVYIP
jgi:ABC-type sugar transport system substrate-binding protein